jgi:hypothetical protein
MRCYHGQSASTRGSCIALEITKSRLNIAI